MLLIHKDKILRRIATEYPKIDKNLLSVILYGSVARGNYKPTSDIDILLLTENTKETRKLFSDFREKIFSETSVVISAIYVTPKLFDSSRDPLIEKIKEEGIVLWRK